MDALQKINILFEDNHLLVVEKPVNMPVCEDESRDKDLLSNLKEYIKIKYDKPGNVYLGLVHRLDRPVGGVMVFAKTSKAASRLSKQVASHELKKTYVAVVCGKVPENGKFLDYLVKNTKRNHSYVTDRDHGKEARLSFKRLGYKDGVSLVEVYLETGRSHQIRVQLKHIGHPVYGDVRYGGDILAKGHNLALWSYKLRFTHPTTKQIMSFIAMPPEDKVPWSVFNL